MPHATRVLALVEASTVTGPVKNLLEFFRFCSTNAPDVQMSFAIFERSVGVNGTNEFLEATTQLGIPVHRIPEAFLFDARIIHHLRHLVDLLTPDIIQTHASKSHVVMRVSGLWKRRPWIGFHHGDSWPRFRSRVYNRLGHFSLRSANRVVAVSEESKRYLATLGVPPHRIKVIHNAVNVPERIRESGHARELRSQLNIQQNAFVILAIGRLSPEKGYVDLIAALASLDKLHPTLPSELLILGDGPERQRIVGAIASAGLQSRVRLLGHIADVSAYYAIADLFVISSISEGSPNVLLEALAACVPVVATAVGGIPEIVRDHESALLVQPKLPHKMAEAMHVLLVDQQLRQNIIATGRKLVSTHFSREVRAQALLDLYKNVVA